MRAVRSRYIFRSGARLGLALILAASLAPLLGGCAMPFERGSGGTEPPARSRASRATPPATDRDRLLDTVATCHLLRVVQSDDVAVTDAAVLAAVERYDLPVEQVIERADRLVRGAVDDPVRLAALRQQANSACVRLAALAGVSPGLVRFDDRGNLGSTWVIVEGEITPGFAARTMAALRQERAVGLIIRSPGGSVHEARQLGRYLRENGLRVAVDDLCTSACVDVLAGGIERYVTANARLGIHQSKVPKQLSSHEGGQFSVATAALYLGEMGVDNTLALLAAAMPHEQVFWISLPQALETRLATRLVPKL